MELTIYERDNSIAHEKVESIDRICIFLVSVVIFLSNSISRRYNNNNNDNI